jgi:integrase
VLIYLIHCCSSIVCSRFVLDLFPVAGLRIGELLALRRKSIDLLRGCSGLRRPFTMDTSTAQRQGGASIPIGSESISILSALLSKTGEPDSLVFSTCSGQPLCRRNLLHRQLQPACVKLGLPKIAWHSLRHCHATLLDSVGAPLGTVQALLGHALSDVTRQIYLHAIPAEQRRAVDGVEKLLIGPKWTQIAGVVQNQK